jgi:phosphoglycolate phosphatase
VRATVAVPTPTPLRAVLFDFDYTLGDSSDGIVACVNHALLDLDRPPADPDAIRRAIGLTLEEIFERLTGEAPAPLGFRARFTEHADRVMLDSTVLYPEVPEVVASLARDGLRLGVVSTKYARRIEAILDRERLRSSFAVVVGSDSVPASKPDPAGLLAALSALSLAPGEALYVGDSVVDAEAAHRAGVPFVAVLSGPTPRSELEALGAIAVLARLAELPGWLAR